MTIHINAAKPVVTHQQQGETAKAQEFIAAFQKHLEARMLAGNPQAVYTTRSGVYSVNTHARLP